MPQPILLLPAEAQLLSEVTHPGGYHLDHAPGEQPFDRLSSSVGCLSSFRYWPYNVLEDMVCWCDLDCEAVAALLEQLSVDMRGVCPQDQACLTHRDVLKGKPHAFGSLTYEGTPQGATFLILERIFVCS